MKKKTFKDIISSLPIDKPALKRPGVQKALVAALAESYRNAKVAIGTYRGTEVESISFKILGEYDIHGEDGVEVTIYRYGPKNGTGTAPGYYYRVGFDHRGYSLSWAAVKCTTADAIHARMDALVSEESEGIPDWVYSEASGQYSKLKEYAAKYGFSIYFYRNGPVIDYGKPMTEADLAVGIKILKGFGKLLKFLRVRGITVSYGDKWEADTGFLIKREGHKRLIQ